MNLWIYGFVIKNFLRTILQDFYIEKNSLIIEILSPRKNILNLIYSKKIQSDFFVSILNNKLLFSFFCTKHNIPIPLLTSYNCKNHFYLANQKYSVYSLLDLKTYFRKVFFENNCDSIFIKSLSNKGGTGIMFHPK